jgi:hypothetical protein
MSLDFYLISGTVGWDGEHEIVFSSNITHNLNQMAEAAGLYKVLWKPEELGISTAAQAIPYLREGVCKLICDPVHFKGYNPPNGWGDYKGLLGFALEVLEACVENPEATIEVCR